MSLILYQMQKFAQYFQFCKKNLMEARLTFHVDTDDWMRVN